MKRIYFMFAMLMALVFGATAQNQVPVTYEVTPVGAAQIVATHNTDILELDTTCMFVPGDSMSIRVESVEPDFVFERYEVTLYYLHPQPDTTINIYLQDTMLYLDALALYKPDENIDSIHIVARFTFPDNITDISSLTTFRIWPVPTTDRLYMEVQPKMVQVYNIQGQLLLTGNTKELNVSSLPAGTYTLRIVTQDGRVGTAKFIKY